MFINSTRPAAKDRRSSATSSASLCAMPDVAEAAGETDGEDAVDGEIDGKGASVDDVVDAAEGVVLGVTEFVGV